MDHTLVVRINVHGIVFFIQAERTNILNVRLNRYAAFRIYFKRRNDGHPNKNKIYGMAYGENIKQSP